MEKLQVLVTTMREKDLSKYHSMNLQTDALIANQSDTNEFQSAMIDGHHVQLLTTSTRGTSRNRNLAIIHSSPEAEYLMFADDDQIMVDDYEKIVLDIFAKHPRAEAIKFCIEAVQARNMGRSYTGKFKKAHILSVTSCGIQGLVIKRDILLKHNLHFNEYFGPGTPCYCGEDSIFLQDLLKKGVRLYLSPIVVSTIYETGSTWYEGYTEKYFKVSGMILSAIFPVLAYPLAIRSAYRFSRRKDCAMKFSEILNYYWKGIREYRKH